MLKIFCLLVLGFGLSAHAGPPPRSEAVDGVASGPPAPAGVTLPRCVDDKATLESIKVESSNKDYSTYRKELSRSSDVELVARLAYAEAKGANCPNREAVVGKLIANSIVNRVNKRKGKGDVHSVIFQPQQFNSSLAVYGESRYQEFLCPKDSGLWKTVYEEARRALAGPIQGLSPDSVGYFLYKHSDKWPKPSWEGKVPVDQTVTDKEVLSCIKFVMIPSWR